jgi:hypothetical protein
MREDRRKNRNNRNKEHGQKKQPSGHKEQKDTKVPMQCVIQNSKETDTIELKCIGIDGSVDKTKIHIYEDGSD